LTGAGVFSGVPDVSLPDVADGSGVFIELQEITTRNAVKMNTALIRIVLPLICPDLSYQISTILRHKKDGGDAPGFA